MKKVLILGSNGLIGNTLSKYFFNKKNIKILCCVRSIKNNFCKKINFYYYNDLNKKKNFKFLDIIINQFKPDYIINCCGITKHISKKKNLIINYYLPLYLANLIEKKNGKLIHISTDCVFNGKKGNYNERSIYDSEDNYGQIKGALEEKLREFYNTIILRTSTIGHEIDTKNGLLEWFLSQKKNKLVTGYKNAYFSGPTALELAKIIYKHLILKNKIKNGIFNISGFKINKYNLLKKINKIYNTNIKVMLNKNLKIDRTLSSKKFFKITKYKKKNWNQLIKEMKKFYEKFF